MSADAKVWLDDDPEKGWRGIHDGVCQHPGTHDGTMYDLSTVLTSIEQCMGGSLRWQIREYPTGYGLAGFHA